MPFDWSTLRIFDPAALAPARAIAHHALQWPARAARANLASSRDNGHSGLSWHPGTCALFTPLLPGDVRVGLRVHGLSLLFMSRGAVEDGFALTSSTAAEADRWLDGKLAHAGLKPASRVPLRYAVPMPDYGRAARAARELTALATWCAAGVELLEAQRAKYLRLGVTPVCCWPQPFCIAFLAALERARGDEARSVDIGLSLGDRYYAQPYAYVSPHPQPEAKHLPALPSGGCWHTQGFVAAVATAAELLARPDPRGALVELIDAAFEAGSTLPLRRAS